jgi:LysM repeat protein
MRNILIVLLILVNFISNAQLSRKEYIEKYEKLAIREMYRTGIPASITLAQGLLESNNGNSMLATKAKNHFGIKCHSSWDGKKVYKDDDKKHECFRKYKTDEESYVDHSDFLKNGKRYQFLFDLKPDNYKGWAKGLKKAGYATNPKYPTLLIKLIEDNKLYKYDKVDYKEYEKENEQVAENIKDKKNKKIVDKENEEENDGDEYIIKKRPKPVEDYKIQLGYEIKIINRVKYTTAKHGDTFEKLTEKFGKMRWELPKYNDLPKNAKLKSGQVIYLQPKRNKAEFGNDYYIMGNGESIYTISQKYAVKIEKIREYNGLSESSKINVGDKIWLHKK